MCPQAETSDTPWSSVDSSEVEKFNGIGWWDEQSKMNKALYGMNKIRVPFVRDGILKGLNHENSESNTALEGFKILDIGCGGGIFSEGLGKIGATVIGIDPGNENVTIARNHLPQELKSRVQYQCTTIEKFQQVEGMEEYFDGVVMSEVVEHVENPEEFMRAAAKLVKPGGSLFITTPNRTVASWFGAILMAEYVLRILPVGTHAWKKFLTPREIERVLHSCGFEIVEKKGITFNPITYVWDWTNFTSVHYAMHAIKPLRLSTK